MQWRLEICFHYLSVTLYPACYQQRDFGSSSILKADPELEGECQARKDEAIRLTEKELLVTFLDHADAGRFHEARRQFRTQHREDEIIVDFRRLRENYRADASLPIRAASGQRTHYDFAGFELDHRAGGIN